MREDKSRVAFLRAHYRDAPWDFITDWGYTYEPRTAAKSDLRLCEADAAYRRRPVDDHRRRPCHVDRDLQEWDYDSPAKGSLRSYLWERSVRHSIRPDGGDGVLLPYHDLLSGCEKDTDHPRDCIAFVPEEYRGEFSYASEHVVRGSAIAALLSP